MKGGQYKEKKIATIKAYVPFDRTSGTALY